MKDEAIRVIVVDDSILFRTLLRKGLEKNGCIRVVGEAVNGIEALDLILKLRPDVILMDLEMPLMDGLTALQHLMIHIPTPTIILSRLTKEGTARSFDTLKHGAVDFACKNSLAIDDESSSGGRNIIEMVRNAAQLNVEATEPIFPQIAAKLKNIKKVRTLVFCEECGSKEELVVRENEDQGGVICRNCSDYISIEKRNRYRRANFISIVVAGIGSYANLLKLIPALRQDINGALLLLINGEKEHVDEFAEYLNSVSTINVMRVTSDTTIQGGNCYVGCSQEHISLKPFSADYSIKFGDPPEQGSSENQSIYSAMEVLKNRVAAIFLSGKKRNYWTGLEGLQNCGGSIIALGSNKCIQPDMCIGVNERFAPVIAADENDLAELIGRTHDRFRDTIITA